MLFMCTPSSKMMYRAEEAARFSASCLSRAALVKGSEQPQPLRLASSTARTLEHALAYFGSRVLYPARAAVRARGELSRTICEDFVESGGAQPWRPDRRNALQLGYMMACSDLYADSYLAGRVSRSRLRQLVLAHPEEPGRAREICWEVLGQARSGRKRPKSVRPPTAEERRTAG